MAPMLNVKLDVISFEELQAASKKLKLRKACGGDEIPPEYWRIALEDASRPLAEWILEFCNNLWMNTIVPDSWHESRVAALFKKGDLGDCGNYRPISLVCTAYKLFVMILMKRLKDAGVETRMWWTQYGFRSARGTTDALLLVRRVFEQNISAIRRLMVIVLDWAKAFDSIDLECLLAVLARFGIPVYLVVMIFAIYLDRRFFVKVDGLETDWRTQRNGIV